MAILKWKWFVAKCLNRNEEVKASQKQHRNLTNSLCLQLVNIQENQGQFLYSMQSWLLFIYLVFVFAFFFASRISRKNTCHKKELYTALGKWTGILWAKKGSNDSYWFIIISKVIAKFKSTFNQNWDGHSFDRHCNEIKSFHVVGSCR